MTMEFIGGVKITDSVKPEVQEQLAMERLDPKRAIKEISSSALESTKLMLELPYTLNDLRTLVKRGEGKIKFEIFGLEPLIDTLEKITDRLSFALIIPPHLELSRFALDRPYSLQNRDGQINASWHYSSHFLLLPILFYLSSLYFPYIFF